MYGCRGIARSEPVGPVSTIRPAYMTRHAVGDAGDHAQVVRDEEQRHALLVAQRAEQVEDLGLDGDVERGRRLVRDEEDGVAREGHRDHRPLSHATAELVRIVAQPLSWARDADKHEERLSAVQPLPARHAAMALQRLGDLLADREDGVQVDERVLEHHGDTVTADVLELAVA